MSDEERKSKQEKYPPARHPVIRTHPESGKKAVFTNNFFTSHIDEVSEDESNRFLRRLEKAIRDPSIQIRVRWDDATIVMWDNRSVQHTGTDDFLPSHRRMERATILGDRPF
jgi:taurine dioxygenase